MSTPIHVTYLDQAMELLLRIRDGRVRHGRHAVRCRPVTLVQHVDPALDARQRLDALALEADQDASGVLVRSAPYLARLVLRLVEDLGGALLRGPDELSLLEHLGGLLLGTADDRLTLFPGTIGDTSGVLRDAARLAHLVRHGGPKLIDQLKDGGLVEHDVVRQGQLLARGDQ